MVEGADAQLHLLEAAVQAGGEDGQAGEGGDRGDQGGQPDGLAGPVDDLPGGGVQDTQGRLRCEVSEEGRMFATDTLPPSLPPWG